MSVAGVLLAAGGGTRFAGDTHKLLAPLGERRVVDHSLAAVLAAGFDRVLVVAGAVKLELDLDLDRDPGAAGGATRLAVADNPDWADGIATSLQLAVAWARGHDLDVVVVGLADQPFVTAQAWRAVAGHFAAGPDAAGRAAAHPIAVAHYDGRPGNPVGLGRAVWDDLPSAGGEGARLLVRSRPELCAAIACDGDPSDIDTAEDLRRWN
ncbi:MAG TPA: hypothetical protein DEP69_02960 [Acidimicrobiaceae bacterium]|nr:hypothetical protein [Acidimicrobiaceae bacterium]